MIVLHAAFKKFFFIWGEESFTSAEAPQDADPRRPQLHPWAAECASMESALKAAGLDDAASAGERMRVVLPTAGGLPVPSTRLIGSVETDGSAQTMTKWSVHAMHMATDEMQELASAVPGDARITEDGALLCRGVMAALDLCYIAECARWTASLLSRGRFLPDILQTRAPNGDFQYESIWRPLLIGEDAERFGSLADAMPEVIRATAGSTARRRDVLADMVGRITDAMIRSAWAARHAEKAGRDKAGRELSIVERKKRGRLVSALNPHALWARSLGWLGDADGLSVSLESIYPDVREWWGRFEWFARAPFKLCVSLGSEPDASGRWRMEYSLKSLSDGETFSAHDMWAVRGKKNSGAYMRRYALLLLGRIASSVPPVMRSLEAAAPESCLLDMAEICDFLSYQAAGLENMGVRVEYPEWWRESSADMLTLRGRLVSGTVDPSIFAYTVWSGGGGESQETLTFSWEIAVGGETLTPSESRAVRNGAYPLVSIRGKWVFIHRDHLERVARHKDTLPTELTAGEAVRLAVRDPYIDGFSDAPDLEVVYETLRGGHPRVDLTAPSRMHGTLRPYQQKGYSWMAFLTSLGFGVCLADDMGLGKTVQTLALIQHHRDMGDRRPVLLVGPTSVLENWRSEAERFFPDMTVYTHHGRRRARGEDLRRECSRATIVLTSYSLLARDAAEMQQGDWLGVVLDEAQNIKNPDTQQARVCRTLKSEWRVALTGTPIENHVGDLWSMTEFLMPGMLGSRRSFRTTYLKPIQEERDRAMMEALRRQMAPLVMRRMKTDKDIAPELPDKIESKVWCGLTAEQAKMYTAEASRMAGDLEGAEGIRRRGIVLASITRMKQICDHPALMDGGCGASERSSKLVRLMSLAEEMFATGGKALIFTQYVEMGEIMKTQLQEQFGLEVSFLHGGTAREARDRMVRRFQEARGPQFFILSLKAGGVGLNLTGANHVIMYDRWWNPAVENQAIDRAYRIGQSRTVQVHIFCCAGTLEERVDALLKSKSEIASSIIDENGEEWVTEMTDRELKRFVSLSPRIAD